MSKRGLGKGLDALLATSLLAREKQQIVSESQAMSSASDNELRDIAISNLKPGVYQPRKEMAPEALDELAISIQSQGIIQPIIVRQVNDASSSYFEIIAGERRWRAAKQAGLKNVPCIVKDVEDRGAIAMALIENIQREDLNVIEEAQALERLQDEFNLTHQQVADVIGKSRATVSNLLRLNQLDDKVKQLVEQKLLEMGHARALLVVDNQEQIELAQKIADKKLTVRQAEQLVKKYLSEKNNVQSQNDDPKCDGLSDFDRKESLHLSQKLSAMFDAKIAITCATNGKVKMTVNVDEYSKLKQLIAKLEN